MKEKPLPKLKPGLVPALIPGKSLKNYHDSYLSIWRGKWNDIWNYYGDDSEEACLAFIDEFRRTFPKASKIYSDDQILMFGTSLDKEKQ